MKHFFLSFLMCFALLGMSGTATAADSYESNKPSVIVPITLNPAPLKSNRPKTGGQRDVKCYYADGWLHIDFPEQEGLAALSIRTEEGRLYTWHAFGTWKEYSCYIGEMTGTLLISVKTMAGFEYTGILCGTPVYDDNSDWE